MKTLIKYINETLNCSRSEHINEWKISDETSKSVEVNEYSCVKPDNEGVCLELVVPYARYKNRIALYTRDYTYGNNIVFVEACDYIKDDEGYYYDNYGNHPTWRWVLLFKNDAINFLKQLLENNKRKMNIYNICGSLIDKDYGDDGVYEFPCKDDAQKYYTKKKIKEMITKIK